MCIRDRSHTIFPGFGYNSWHPRRYYDLSAKFAKPKNMIKLLVTLEPVHYSIICMRYGLERIQPLTQKETAKVLEISHTRIQSLQYNSEDALRKAAWQNESDTTNWQQDQSEIPIEFLNLSHRTHNQLHRSHIGSIEELLAKPIQSLWVGQKAKEEIIAKLNERGIVTCLLYTSPSPRD